MTEDTGVITGELVDDDDQDEDEGPGLLAGVDLIHAAGWLFVAGAFLLAGALLARRAARARAAAAPDPVDPRTGRGPVLAYDGSGFAEHRVPDTASTMVAPATVVDRQVIYDRYEGPDSPDNVPVGMRLYWSDGSESVVANDGIAWSAPGPPAGEHAEAEVTPTLTVAEAAEAAEAESGADDEQLVSAHVQPQAVVESEAGEGAGDLGPV